MSDRLNWAIRDTVDAYKGTQEELAMICNVNPNTFRNKIKPDKAQPGSGQFNAEELERLISVTRDARTLQVLADQIDHDVVPKKCDGSTPEEMVIQQLYCMVKGSNAEHDLRRWWRRVEHKPQELRKTISAMACMLLKLSEMCDD
ncbi:hypothetical protein VI26_18005 [Chromobacterium sp. LK1]|uniref:phage regulatory CII family protein n=1 Tax=Chromobacterium sp. LK1 TaxID=1628193 RepID=UPI000653397A|nr:phage regulatory CII family protein [Chromobacterium sp. LK1]KMN32067.1 hypothetical protein VI26_18005 [Chromobacterium sp. LK1]